MPDKNPRIVEWYREDPWPRIRRVLLIGPLVLTVGGLIVFVSLVTRQPVHVRIAAAVAGFGLVAGGALWTMIGMQQVLRNEVCLALRTDGIVVQSSGAESLVAWDELDRARWDRALDQLVLERKNAPPIVIGHRFARIDGTTLAQRIDATKRRAAMNLLRTL